MLHYTLKLAGSKLEKVAVLLPVSVMVPLVHF